LIALKPSSNFCHPRDKHPVPFLSFIFIDLMKLVEMDLCQDLKTFMKSPTLKLSLIHEEFVQGAVSERIELGFVIHNFLDPTIEPASAVMDFC